MGDGDLRVDAEDSAAALTELRDFLTAIFADGEGWLCWAIGGGPWVKPDDRYGHRRWEERSLHWPADSELACSQMLTMAQAADVYICPYLMLEGKRRRGHSITRHLIHAEVDCPVDPQQVGDLGGFAVASGSAGHVHVYIPLTGSVGLETHRRLCRALGKHLGAKDLKVSDNDLLRPLGTYNHKPTMMNGGGREPVRVQWLVTPPGDRVDPHKLADLLGESVEGQETPPAPPEPADGCRGEAVTDLALRYPTVHAALEMHTGDRSADTIRITKACKVNGLTLAQTRWVVDQREDLRQRLDERNDDDVARCYSRAEPDSDEQAQKTTMNAGQLQLEDAYVSEYIGDKLRGEFLHSGVLGWLRFDGKRWNEVAESAVVEKVRTELIDLHVAEATERVQTNRLKQVSGLLSAAKIRAICYLLKANLSTNGEFDAHPDLLNVANGVVDLRTGELRPHEAALLLTKIAPVSYRPDARHGDWDAALAALPVDAVEWLQVRLGQGITGHPVPDDRLVVLQGTGANGKTTILDAVRAALGGDFAVTMPERVLLARSGDHPTELMTMRGARLAFMEEFPELGHLNVKRLKDVLGTGEMTARLIRQDSVSWKPSHTPMVTTNGTAPSSVDSRVVNFRPRSRLVCGAVRTLSG